MLEDHPLAALIPPMRDDDYAALRDDIAMNGLQQPIVLHEGRILDGRHRYRACLELGIAPRTIDYTGDAPLAYVVSLNIARRHLTADQRAVLAVRLKAPLAEEARRRQHAAGQFGTLGGRGHRREDRASEDAESDGAEGKTLPQNFGEGFYGAENRRARETDRQLAALAGVNHTYIAYADYLQRHAPDAAERILRGEAKLRQTYRDVRQRDLAEAAPPAPPLPHRRYRCLVIDPPWPVEKLLRDVTPHQNEFAYPTMTLEEIADLPVPDLIDPAGCHVYLWVTHRYLPYGLGLFERWGVRYQCVLTWVKNVGMTPYSWMYSTEHVLFGRVGSLDVLRDGLRLDFTAPRREHSRKPDVFYDRVRQASPGPRLELFARERRDGFDGWGNEVDRFAPVAPGMGDAP
jgi:N6-adenosine-specific RNA methylase IME4